MQKNLDIEALRGYAIGLTVGAHLARLVPSWDRWVYAFWLGGGVDLFFAISGFIITRSLLESGKREGEKSRVAIMSAFWIRRVFRLWPAAIFWAAATVIAAATFNRLGLFLTFDRTLKFALAGMGQVANIYTAVCSRAQPVPCQFSNLAIYWSLSLEEQFYVLFPLALLFVPRRRLVGALVVIALGQLFLDRQWPSPLWFFRTDALSFGVLIALMPRDTFFMRAADSSLARNGVRRTLVPILLVLLIVVATPKLVAFYNGAVSLVSAALVLIASFDRAYIVRHCAIQRLTSWIGARSYSLYLTHLFAFYLARELYARISDEPAQTVGQTTILIVLAIALTVALTEFSYRAIEMPCRIKGRAIASGKSFAN
ncbi:acyltransferase family protein [Caballeronia zhejiangensis]|uniref:acyltransferase family protein n=1 Tax=Caballeronia zhejiangensis TaxID=871203 RepID=UPI00031DA3C0|nr:acyltransferase [Caballeronia zhejiangensis]